MEGPGTGHGAKKGLFHNGRDQRREQARAVIIAAAGIISKASGKPAGRHVVSPPDAPIGIWPANRDRVPNDQDGVFFECFVFAVAAKACQKPAVKHRLKTMSRGKCWRNTP
jgi:hypothetical protein